MHQEHIFIKNMTLGQSLFKLNRTQLYVNLDVANLHCINKLMESLYVHYTLHNVRSTKIKMHKQVIELIKKARDTGGVILVQKN